MITPVKIKISDNLTGYACNLESNASQAIIIFGGSNYIAYNTIGKYGEYYNCPVFSVDYYGTQDSKGKMNLKTMQNSATELYDWIKKQYPNMEITVIGHSYGCGMASYLASERKCSNLLLMAAYRDISDLYNHIIPIFRGPLKVFISNNMYISEYAKKTTCNVYIFGSDSDKTLSAELQPKVAKFYDNVEVYIFENIEHEYYLTDTQVVNKVNQIVFNSR